MASYDLGYLNQAITALQKVEELQWENIEKAAALMADAIEKDEHFKSATLPLSDLAKDKDISFTITIEPNAKLTQ